MRTNTQRLLLLLTITSLSSGCGGGGSTPPPPESLANAASEASLSPENAAAVLSSALHDILDITQLMLAAQDKSYQLRVDIQSVQDQNSRLSLTDIPCENVPSSYNLVIQHYAPGHDLEGTTLAINLGGQGTGVDINPDQYCRFGGMNISGFMQVTRLTFSITDPNQPDGWQMSGEIWPTLTIHDGTSLTAINNPLSFSASHTAASGLSVSGTVIDAGNFVGDVRGMVVTHYTAGADPNTLPVDILQNGFSLTAKQDHIDPLAASRLSIAADGLILSNLTSTDISMAVRTVDATGSQQPMTWLNSVVDAPQIQPPTTGALTINDNSNGSSITAAVINSSGLGDINLEIINNALPADDPLHVTNVVTNWAEVLSLH